MYKSETLSSSEFTAVFQCGERFFSYPVTLIGTRQSTENKKVIKVGFAVPKRLVKKAVHRNRIKRMLRAAYQNVARGTIFDKNLQMIFLYTEKKEQDFNLLEAAIQKNVQLFLR